MTKGKTYMLMGTHDNIKIPNNYHRSSTDRKKLDKQDQR